MGLKQLTESLSSIVIEWDYVTKKGEIKKLVQVKKNHV